MCCVLADHDLSCLVMSATPIHIRNPHVVRAIRTLARETGRPITETVAEAVRAASERWQSDLETERRQRRDRIDAVRLRYRALPRLGPALTEADIYDEDGMPR